MDTSFSQEDLAFRDEVAAFFDEAFTDELRALFNHPKRYPEAIVGWQRKLYERGWVAPNWPVEHGGAGWTATQNYIFDSERSARGIPNTLPL